MLKFFKRLIVVCFSVLTFASSSVEARVVRILVPPAPDQATQEFLATFISAPAVVEAGITLEQVTYGTLGPLSDTVRFLREGIIHLALLPANAVPNISSNEALTFTKLITSPSFITSAREQFHVEDSPFGAIVANEVGQQGVVVISFWNRAANALVLRRQAREPGDMRGLKIRSPSVQSQAALQALGAAPTAIAPGEVYSGLQSGVIDGAEVALDGAAQDILELMSGGSLLAEYQQQQGFLVAGEEFWVDITQKERAALQKTAENATSSARATVLAIEERTPALADRYGLTYAKFSEFAPGFAATSARDAWLRGTGEAGARALDLLTSVKNRTSPTPGRRGGAPNQTFAQTRIIFATNRHDEGAPDLSVRFGIKRDPAAALTCGEVSYVKDPARTFGSLHSGPVSLAGGLATLGPVKCAEYVANLATSSGGALTIFVHGYWTSFDAAIRRAIGFAHDLEIQTPILVWAWPSQSTLSGYVYDVLSVGFTRPYLEDFSEELLKFPAVNDITVFAHSMGSQIAIELLKIGKVHSRKFSNFVLIAPDVPQTLFRQGIRLYGKHASAATLYANEHDGALAYSWTVNREAPAGLAGDSLLVIDGIETVDVSSADDDWWPASNHSHGFDVPIVARDVSALLSQRKPAASRGLQSKLLNSKPYWLIEP